MISREISDLIEQGCVPEGSRQNLYATTVVVDWRNTDEARRILLTDAQTSGGLLLCVAEAKLEKVLDQAGLLHAKEREFAPHRT